MKEFRACKPQRGDERRRCDRAGGEVRGVDGTLNVVPLRGGRVSQDPGLSPHDVVLETFGFVE